MRVAEVGDGWRDGASFRGVWVGIVAVVVYITCGQYMNSTIAYDEGVRFRLFVRTAEAVGGGVYRQL